MARSMQPITGVTEQQLSDYNPEAFDAHKQPNGTYTLVPVRWMNQEEYNEVEYGCGGDDGSGDQNPVCS